MRCCPQPFFLTKLHPSIDRKHDQRGESALHRACRFGQKSTAQWLAEQMTREAIVALNQVRPIPIARPNLESHSSSVSLSLSLSLPLSLSLSLCLSCGCLLFALLCCGSPTGHQFGKSALQVWGWKDEESDEDMENEGKAAFRAFIEMMLADVL